MTPDISKLRTPKVPSSEDTILTESQNILALQVVETPLKGGLNTPLHNSDFSSTAPVRKVVQTPNTMFQTPFRTPHGEVNATPTRTPMIGGSSTSNALAIMNGSSEMDSQSIASSVRDKLSINPAEGLAFNYNDDKAKHREYLNELKKGLSKLPAPKNDYEIVLPEEDEKPEKKSKNEEDEQMDESEVGEQFKIIDRADLIQKEKALLRQKYLEEMKLKSTSVQRDLPRPTDINHSIIRPAEIVQAKSLSDYQEAEEMIKKEMLIMLHNDALNNPTLNQCGIPIGSKKPATNLRPLNIEKHQGYLRENEYELFSKEEMEEAKKMLEKEVPTIKKVMGHGEITDEVYAQVWEECYNQVLYVPSSNRFTRANVTSRKDKIESYEKRLEVNRFHMTNEAKKAAKLEQKLKITHGGYQVSI